MMATDFQERLDFSCALFSSDGGLVANAPHVPVHLGAMASSVQAQLKHWSRIYKPQFFPRTAFLTSGWYSFTGEKI